MGITNPAVQSNQTGGVYVTAQSTGQSSSSTYDLRTFSFIPDGIVSAGWSNGSFRVSATQSNQALSGQNGSFTFQTASFSNANGISFGTSAGPAITASHNALTSQSNQALSGSNGSFTFQTATFGNLNNFSFYTSNGSLVGSYTVPTVTNSSWTVSDAGTSGTVARLAFTNLNGVTLSLSSGAGGSHTIVGSHNALTTAALSNHSHGVTLALTNLSGTTGGNSVGIQLSLSANDPGAAAEANWHNLTGNTAGQTTISGSTILFEGGNNITLSGVNASRIRIDAAAGGGGGTLSAFNPVNFTGSWGSAQIGNGVILVVPIGIREDVIVSRANIMISNTVSTSSNSSHAGVISVGVGLYTRNANTLSAATTGSVAHQWTNTSNNSTQSLNGLRLLSCPVAATITPGNYWIAVFTRTSTTNANWFTASNIIVSRMTNVYSGPLLSATSATQHTLLGQGSYSATTGGPLPASMAFSHITGTNATQLWKPIMNFVNFTSP